jgi:cytochrome c biogenesis protein CcmG, thiol:disulfide interchange protein DsbE
VIRTSTLLLSALAMLACAGQAPRPTVKLPPLAGRPLDVTAQDLSGHPVRIDAGNGQVLVVDFFASWCEPCKIQLPHLEQLERELHDQGLAVYGVSFDDDLDAIRGMATQLQIGFPILWDRGGDKLAPALSIQRLPTTLLVDRSGTIRSVHLGYDSRAGQRLDEEVRTLLKEPVPAPTTASSVQPPAEAAR